MVSKSKIKEWKRGITSNKDLFSSTGSRQDAEMIGVKLRI